MELLLKNTGKSDTRVITGPKALSALAEISSGYTKTILITDQGTKDNCLEAAKQYLPGGIEVIVLEGGEKDKSLDKSKDLLGQLQKLACDRKSLVIGLGGGVVSDIAGFVASIYMRGIDWVMLPTTLTAQADASIGGKTGVNSGQYKNMIGSFWPPKAVLINPGFLNTLPQNHLRNGLAEIIKMGIIYNRQILDHVMKLDPADMLGNELEKASELAIRGKVEIVNKDMYESSERKLLNFGHTVGHAIERLPLNDGGSLLHGEAIAVGMVAESKLAELEAVAEAGLSAKIADLLQKFGLPVSATADMQHVLETIASDKKNVGSDINWTLPKAIGEGIFNHVSQQSNIEQAIKTVLR